MKSENHNLTCSLAAFLLAGFLGFAFTGGLTDLASVCLTHAAHDKPKQ